MRYRAVLEADNCSLVESSTTATDTHLLSTKTGCQRACDSMPLSGTVSSDSAQYGLLLVSMHRWHMRVWITNFHKVTHQSSSPTWIKRVSKFKVRLADVQLYVFCQKYRQQNQRRGPGKPFEICFVSAEGESSRQSNLLISTCLILYSIPTLQRPLQPTLHRRILNSRILNSQQIIVFPRIPCCDFFHFLSKRNMSLLLVYHPLSTVYPSVSEFANFLLFFPGGPRFHVTARLTNLMNYEVLRIPFVKQSSKN